ncbi:MAG: nucleotide exchange factor GrpE [Desulfotignum sp.]|nr:nucleotide exchange factor GrpE [Desulfotignum sp.]
MVLKEKSRGGPNGKDPSPLKETESAVEEKDTDGLDSTSQETDIASLEAALEAEKDRFIRLSAEFDNYRKRKQREIDEFKKFANEMVFKQFLPVVDNLERAMASAENNQDLETLLKGVKLTHKEILKVFQQFHVKSIQAENQLFDPNFHQAVTQKETNEVPENTVTDVLQTGYLLNDRLIRPAMVVVSKSTGNDTDEPEEK